LLFLNQNNNKNTQQENDEKTKRVVPNAQFFPSKLEWIEHLRLEMKSQSNQFVLISLLIGVLHPSTCQRTIGIVYAIKLNIMAFLLQGRV